MKHVRHLGFATVVMALVGCGNPLKNPAQLSGAPDLEMAKHAIEYYGCASCHQIPGTAGAQGLIGPSLEHFANRNFIGGVLKKSPDNLLRWINDAPAIDPRTAMPDLKVPDDQARIIASYLNTLR